MLILPQTYIDFLYPIKYTLSTKMLSFTVTSPDDNNNKQACLNYPWISKKDYFISAYDGNSRPYTAHANSARLTAAKRARSFFKIRKSYRLLSFYFFGFVILGQFCRVGGDFCGILV